MSNTKKANFHSPVSSTTTEESNANETIEAVAPKINPVTNFVQKHKTWFIAGAAATLGFVAHGFLGRPDTCTAPQLEYDADFEYAIEDTPEED